MKIICISGSVGTGKTTLAKRISKKVNYKYADVTQLIKKNKIYDSYDRKRKCYITNIKKLNRFLIDKIKKYKKNNLKGIVIDSHLSHYLPKKYVDLCIITKCDLKELQKRLKKREYSKDKIQENLECEIFDVCLNEAKEAGHKVIVFNATKALNMDMISKSIK